MRVCVCVFSATKEIVKSTKNMHVTASEKAKTQNQRKRKHKDSFKKDMYFIQKQFFFGVGLTYAP